LGKERFVRENLRRQLKALLFENLHEKERKGFIRGGGSKASLVKKEKSYPRETPYTCERTLEFRSLGRKPPPLGGLRSSRDSGITAKRKGRGTCIHGENWRLFLPVRRGLGVDLSQRLGPRGEILGALEVLVVSF